MKFRFTILILLAIGCRTKADKGNSTNVQSIIIGDTKVVAKYMDEDYGTRKSIGNRIPDTIVHFLYFNVKFEKKWDTKFSKEKTLYLNFDMQQDFTLVDGRDSISASFCQRIENGIRENYEYMLAFENRHAQHHVGNQTLVYKDKLFGIGTIAFAYE